MRLRSSRTLDRVASRDGSRGVEEAWVRAELNASETVVDLCECTKWQPHQVSPVLVPEAPVTVLLEPLSARDVCYVHVADTGIHRSIV